MTKPHVNHHGEVVAVRAHHSNPKFMNIEVAHGKRARPKKGQIHNYDDRPTSSLVIPKEHASRYRIGQKVGVGATPLGDDGPDGEPDGDIDDAMDDYRSTQRGIASYGNKKRR